MDIFLNYGILAGADDGASLPGWAYAKKITIPASQIDAPLTNFPCPVYLNSSNFDFSQAKADGSDIRFTDGELNLLKFERVEHYPDHMRIATSTTSTDLCAFTKSVTLTTANTLIAEARLRVESAGSANGQTLYMYNSAGKLAQIMLTTTGIKCNPFGTTPITILADNKSDFHTFRIKFNGTTNVEYYIDDVLKHTTPYAELFTNAPIANTLGFGDPNNTANTGGSIEWKSVRYNTDYGTTPENFVEWDPSLGLPTANGWTAGGTASLATIFDASGKYNVLLPSVSDTTDTEFYMFYGNEEAYNTSIEAWQDQTRKVLTYNGNVKLVHGVETGRRVAYFDGSGDYFELPNTTQFGIGSNNFKIGIRFMRGGGIGTSQCIYDRRSTTTAQHIGNDFSIYLPIANTPQVSLVNGTTAYTVESSIAITDTNVMHYLEFSRTGNTLYLFIDGVLTGTAACSVAMNTGSNKPTIGRLGEYATGYGFNGYISEFEILVGTYGHTSNYTAPTAPAVVTADTKFLCLFDTIYDTNYAMVQHTGDSLVDATGNGNNGTATGTTVVNTEYGKARNFNGTSDYITLGQAFLNGVSNCNLLALLKADAIETRKFYSFDSGDTPEVIMGYNSNLKFTGYASSATQFDLNYAFSDTTDFRVAGLKVAPNDAKMFLDGASVASDNSVSLTFDTASAQHQIGAYSRTGSYFDGMISEFRISLSKSDAWIKAESLALKKLLLTMETA